MKILATVMMLKLINKERKEQLKYIRSNLENKEFMELIYLGYHTGISFNIAMDEVKPRPQVPEDNHKTFFKLAMDSARNPFDLERKEGLKKAIGTMCPLSQYIYAKIINQSLGLSRNDLEANIQGLIEKEAYEHISDYGSPKIPFILQVYNEGIEAIITIGDTSIVRDVNLLKDKSGNPISGFEEHLLEFKNLGLKGTFNVIISGINEEVYMEHALGNISRTAAWEPITIIDYQIDAVLTERLMTVEIALIEHPSVLIELATSVVSKSIEDVYTHYKYNKAIARQNLKPILRETGNHAIDISYLI